MARRRWDIKNPDLYDGHPAQGARNMYVYAAVVDKQVFGPFRSIIRMQTEKAGMCTEKNCIGC